MVFNNNAVGNGAICCEDNVKGSSRLATCLRSCTSVPLSPQACNVHSHMLLIAYPAILTGYVMHAVSSLHCNYIRKNS